MTTADVTIRGAGIFGLATGFVCACRGAKVRIIETKGIGAGSSGGVVGALAPHTPENWNPKKAFQFESLIMAPLFWRKVEKLGRVPSGYGQTGRVQPILDDKALDLAHRRAGTATELWQGMAKWEVCATTGSDWEPASPTGYVIRDTLTARIQPYQACHALAKAIIQMGGQIRSDSYRDEGRVLWATGYEGLKQLGQELQKPVGGGIKGQAALLQYRASQLPQIYAESLHIVPHFDDTVGIGSTSEREFDSPSDTDEQLDEVLQRAYDALPCLRDAPIVQRWAGVRPRAKSRAPMLGHFPGKQGHYVANGGFKIGFGMAPKIAHVMANLMLDGADEIPQGFRVEDSF
ncbi:NAD(P)/FAD-dependent oxidoreductase [Algirhabdus cladophorae]|uniref:NAD(P)/FAD-dependent oxidoreductase n=1 Tax=Algirhabdus cladophorae TaxID=3377108 RepID=UPI003B8466C6